MKAVNREKQREGTSKGDTYWVSAKDMKKISVHQLRNQLETIFVEK